MSETELSPGVKRLRMIVIIMGFVLVFGTLALFVAVFIKFSHKKTDPVNSYVVESPSKNEKCSFKTAANIELVGEIVNSSINGNILTLITAENISPFSLNKIKQDNSINLEEKYDKPKQEVVIFDLCKGEILSRINVLN